MTEHHDATRAGTQRERELELEVGRLQAELDASRGEDPTKVASRLLAMAATTADLAVADAHREADEIIEEVSAQAEARRDEATRVASEAEALAEEKLAEADKAQEQIEEATEQAASIRAAAEVEAEHLVQVERVRVAEELSALAEVRGVLESERGALESYHEQLRRRVNELAESMVSFMTTQPPIGVNGAFETLVPAQLEAVLAANPDLGVTTDDAAEEFDDEPAADGDMAEVLESAISADTQIVDVPDTSIDEIPEGPGMWFGGARVVEDVEPATEHDVQASAGLFSRSDDSEIGFEDLVVEDDEEDTPLFASFGARLLEQSPPSDLADALERDDVEDQAFRQFLDGDDAPDPSRDWLLRPESS